MPLIDKFPSAGNAGRVRAECLDCGTVTPFNPAITTCLKCNSQWREARYDYDEIARVLIERIKDRAFDLWRYAEVLPIDGPKPQLSLGEGGTPMVQANNLGTMLGCSNIYIKDERQGPTASFKDRQAALSISALKETGITEMVLASTGNVAIAYSAYAARAGIKLWAFLTSLVPGAKMREVALYGTQVIKVTGSYDQAKQVAAEFAKQRGIFFDLGSRSIPCVEGMKTISYEVCEQLARVHGLPPSLTPWRAPDWYVQSVSGGLGPLGAIKGFAEIHRMGLTTGIPKLACIQAEGCSPMVQAWKQNRETAIPFQSPHTLIATLATGDPGRTYTELRKRILAFSGGVFDSVSDEEAFRAMHYLAKMEGLSVEPAAAVAIAGVVKLIRAGQIKTTDVVVINCTGHTMPIERNILGEGWARNLVLPTQMMEESPEEGLLAALNNVAVDRFPRVAIVDDNPDVRRLIRRILQSQGNYTIYEATNGREAVELAHREHPNLMILDLMMPEMDGFAVIEALQSAQDTAEIPVIVVTAKELTVAEKSRLEGHIKTLMQKGDFMSDDLLDEVRSLLR
jgi:threonine synthase